MRSAEGAEQSGDTPLSPLSRSGIDVVGKRQLGPLYVGLLSFLVPVPSLYVPVPSLYVPVPSLSKNRAGHGNGASWATESVSGQAPSTPVFREKRSAPASPLSCRDRESTLRIAQLEPLHVGLLSFLVPVPSLYVPVPSLGGSRRPTWSSASPALTNFSRVEWASDIRWSRRFAPVPSG